MQSKATTDGLGERATVNLETVVELAAISLAAVGYLYLADSLDRPTD